MLTRDANNNIQQVFAFRGTPTVVIPLSGSTISAPFLVRAGVSLLRISNTHDIEIAVGVPGAAHLANPMTILPSGVVETNGYPAGCVVVFRLFDPTTPVSDNATVRIDEC